MRYSFRIKQIQQSDELVSPLGYTLRKVFRIDETGLYPNSFTDLCF